MGSATKQWIWSVGTSRNGSITAVVGSGIEQHVGFVDCLEPANRGAVEAVARHEAFLGELLDRDGEVLHQPGKVAEPKVHDLGATLLRKCQDVLRCFRHIRLLIDDRDTVRCPRVAAVR